MGGAQFGVFGRRYGHGADQPPIFDGLPGDGSREKILEVLDVIGLNGSQYATLKPIERASWVAKRSLRRRWLDVGGGHGPDSVRYFRLLKIRSSSFLR